MKISEIKNEEALDLIMNCIEPAVEIFGDKVIADALRKRRGRKDLIKLVKKTVSTHKKAVIQILAYTSGVDPKEYSANALEMISQVLELLNDDDLMNFFSSQVPTTGQM